MTAHSEQEASAAAAMSAASGPAEGALPEATGPAADGISAASGPASPAGKLEPVEAGASPHTAASPDTGTPPHAGISPDEAKSGSKLEGHSDGEDEGEDSADVETPWDYRDGPVFRRKAVLVAILSTLALAALGSYIGYISIPAALRDGSSRAGAAILARAGYGGAVICGILVFSGIIASVALAWPLPGYGPKPAPKPRPLWLGLLRLVGCWLLMFPFSFICLLLVAFGIDSAVGGSWGPAAILIAIGLVFGAGACVLLAGSGITTGAKMKPGGKVPETVLKSRWWKHVLWMLTLWALLLTGLAIAFGVAGKWDHFWEMLTGAAGSWIALAVAAGGELPEESFELG